MTKRKYLDPRNYNVIKNIYIDMDGVLCDFNKHYRSLFGMDPKEARDQKYGLYLVNWNKFVDDKEFENIPPLAGYDFILHAIDEFRRDMEQITKVNIQILTSSGGKDKHEQVAEQKKAWLKKHSITYDAIVVPGRRYKQECANPNSILIDDTQDVIEDWKEVGGIGIQHKGDPRDVVWQFLRATTLERERKKFHEMVIMKDEYYDQE